MRWNGELVGKSMATETTTWSELEQILASNKEVNLKEQDYDSHSLGSE